MDTVVLFISPHLDDAIFSCGGYINHLTTQGTKVVIATIFTADNDSGQPLSELAQHSMRVWGLGDRPFVRRCEEDRLAAIKLGADVAHLGFHDCIYRRDKNGDFLYKERVKDVPVHALDLKNLISTLQIAIEGLLHQYSSDKLLVFCPLSIGGHVDHIIVRRAVESVPNLQPLIYYEELPYALYSEGNKEQYRSLRPYTFRVSAQEIQSQLDALACYASQIPGLFPSQWEVFHQIMNFRLPISRRFIPIRYNLQASLLRMNTAIREYRTRLGGERYWSSSDLLDVFGKL